MTSFINRSDEELLQTMMAGDEEAFVTLYRRWQSAIYRFALHMGGCPHAADDVTQEVFMQLIRDPKKYDSSRGSLSAYLYGIARNQVLRRLSREPAHATLTLEAEDGMTEFVAQPATVSDPLGDLTRNETMEALRQAILALPEHYREVIVLCDLQEMSYAESAAALACSIGTIRSRLHRGRALLADKLRASKQDVVSEFAVKTERCMA